VDITSLESAVSVLQNLREYVNNRLVGDAAAKLKLEAPGGSNAPNDTTVIFGGFPAAQALATKHNQFYETVGRAYSALVESLDDAVDGTRRIIDTYKTVEERNRAAVADITRLLSSDEPPPSAPSTPPASTQSASYDAGSSSPSAESGDTPPKGDF
jgi:hypothetical protein